MTVVGLHGPGNMWRLLIMRTGRVTGLGRCILVLRDVSFRNPGILPQNNPRRQLLSRCRGWDEIDSEGTVQKP